MRYVCEILKPIPIRSLGALLLVSALLSGCLMTRAARGGGSGSGGWGNGSASYSVIDVGLGAATTCVIVQKNSTGDRRLECLGDGSYNVFSNSTTSVRDYFVFGRSDASNYLTNLSALSMGSYVGCAIRSGSPICWGYNSWGATGYPSGTNNAFAQNISEVLPGSTIGITNSYMSACALQSTGSGNRVYCWGDQGYGKLGNGASNYGVADVSGLISVGYTTNDGLSSAGDLGDGTTGQPTQVTSSSLGHCAVTDSGTVWCWGDADGVGNGSGTSAFVPDSLAMPYARQVLKSDMSALTNVTKVVGGGNHICALTSDSGGMVYCWGSSALGETGLGNTSMAFTAAPVTSLPGPAYDIAASQFSTCAISSGSRSVYCWGSNTDQQLGTNSPAYACGGGTIACEANYSSGVPSSALKIWGANNGAHFCATFTDGSLRCWGDNAFSQLGEFLGDTYFAQMLDIRTF